MWRSNCYNDGFYGYTEDEACAFDGMVPSIDETTGEFLGMIMMFDLGGQTLGDFCGVLVWPCSCRNVSYGLVQIFGQKKMVSLLQIVMVTY